jgi:hypothetical protein
VLTNADFDRRHPYRHPIAPVPTSSKNQIRRDVREVSTVIIWHSIIRLDVSVPTNKSFGFMYC